MAENYVLLEVHNEFAKRMEEEDERQNHRITDLEEHFKIVTNLVVSTEKLALSMESMAKELARQGAKLNDLEMKPAKRWDLLITTIITGIAGAMIGVVVGGWLP
jgi:predicted GIY-YIG superfamily endonuclease